MTWTFHERWGLAHDPQVVAIEGCRAASMASGDGRPLPTQPTAEDERGCLVLLPAIAPSTVLTLHPSDRLPPLPTDPVRVETDGGCCTLATTRIALRLPLGEGTPEDPFAPAWLLGIGRGDGRWYGRSWLDTRAPVSRWQASLEAEGPVRAVWHYRACLGDGGSHTVVVTLDAGEATALVREQGSAGPGDQWVMDFHAGDLPRQLIRTTAGKGHDHTPLHHHADRRLLRLAPWTQQSQLLDLSDGFAWTIGDTAIGVVADPGCAWSGHRANHLEAWCRRLVDDDPRTRRDVPWDQKCDVTWGDRIPARGGSRTTAHFCLEGWLHDCRRAYRLGIWNADELVDGDTRQGELRRLHVQRGVFPLDCQRIHPGGWRTSQPAGQRSDEVIDALHDTAGSETRDLAGRLSSAGTYLDELIADFWNGGGLSDANPVRCRRIVPTMALFERAAAEGLLDAGELDRRSAQFAWLAELMCREATYPGRSSMVPMDHRDSPEPTIQGMANQNFFTDVFAIPGMAAEVFPDHPETERWAGFFARNWSDQLDYHRYPSSGLWEESHTYFHHVLLTVAPVLARRSSTGRDEPHADPRLHSLLAAAVAQLSPHHAWYDDARHIVPFGDHAVQVQQYRPLYRHYAQAVEPHDESLATAYRDMHGDGPLTIPPHPLPWQDGILEGLGAFMRNEGRDGHQQLLALRAGGAWAHHHDDDGSIQLMAGGRSLIVDAGFGRPRSGSIRKVADHGHSRWTLQDRRALDCLWRWNRGRVVDSSGGQPLAHVSAYCPFVTCASRTGPKDPFLLPQPIDHFRHVARLAPSTWLVIDHSNADTPQVVHWHLAGASFDLAAQTATALQPDGNRLIVEPWLEATLSSTDRDEQSEGDGPPTMHLQYAVASTSAFLLDVGTPSDDRPRREGDRLALDQRTLSIRFTPDHCQVEDGSHRRHIPLAPRLAVG